LILKNEKRSIQEIRNKITTLTDKGLLIIETAQFNSIFVFGHHSNEEYNRIIPVTLDSTAPTYKINISSEKYNRRVISSFISNFTDKGNAIEELDKIISEITMERAKLDAYQNRLTYSYQISVALRKGTLTEIKKELNNIFFQMKTDLLVLSIKSANGIYTSNDRKQIQMKYDEINNELIRISSLLKKTNSNKYEENISLLSQPDAEYAMLYLVKKQEK